MGSDQAWSPEAHLLAAAVDVLRAANWQRGGGKGSRPKPLDRPSEQAEKQREYEAHVDRARRFLNRQQNRGES